MKKLILLILITGCYNSPNITNQGSQKTGANDIAANKSDYTNLKEALLNPGKVIKLTLYPAKDSNTSYDIKHLPAEIGTLTNLKELDISCLPNLEDLPAEIGNLKSLEKIVIDNGNGCTMNVAIPSSIGKLSNLKELTLYGGLDNTDDTTKPNKELPQSIANLQNLEVLDLGRNGLKEIPPQVFALHKLRVLALNFNNIKVIPCSITELTNLKELSISLSAFDKIPECLKVFKGLKLNLVYETLEEPTKKELAAQKKLKEEFPDIVITYSDFD